MTEYHKIDTIFKRDPSTKHKTLLLGEYSRDAFEYLTNNEWLFTEKVDGTNIRVDVLDGGNFRLGGRTDAASLPASLVERLNERFRPQQERLVDVFSSGATLYGEGYGARIQKGGGNYRADQDFVLFDVRVGDVWLRREDVKDVAEKLGLDVVPTIGRGTLSLMVESVRLGFVSAWGEFVAEGVVARPATELQDRLGRRVITKLKHRDFAVG